MNDTTSPEPVHESVNETTYTGSNFLEPAKVGLNEAARLTGASRNTIAKYANNGRLSWELDPSGKKAFQVAELQRVFPNIKAQNGSSTGSVSRREPVGNGSIDAKTATIIATLEGEKRVLEAKLQAEKEKGQLLEELAQKEARNADDLRQALKMLAYRPEPVASPAIAPEPARPEIKRGFLARLFGGEK